MSELQVQIPVTLRQTAALLGAVDARLGVLERRIETAAKNRAAGNVTFSRVDEGNRNERARLRECKEQLHSAQRVLCSPIIAKLKGEVA
jgi:hypothetical protein